VKLIHQHHTTFRAILPRDRVPDHLIVCEDDGEGIGADEKEMIFDRGFGKNTGLGLALSREILDITGITIRETGEPAGRIRKTIARHDKYDVKEDGKIIRLNF